MTDQKTVTTSTGAGKNVADMLVTTMAEVFCTLQVEGIHCWPECPFDEVAYLRDPHRHLFHVKAHKFVTHSDRDVEFIMMKHRIEAFLLTEYGQEVDSTVWSISNHKRVCLFGAMSCEMIADQLCTQFDLHKCEVSEDGENGAIVHRKRNY